MQLHTPAVSHYMCRHKLIINVCVVSGTAVGGGTGCAMVAGSGEHHHTPISRIVVSSYVKVGPGVRLGAHSKEQSGAACRVKGWQDP